MSKFRETVEKLVKIHDVLVESIFIELKNKQGTFNVFEIKTKRELESLLNKYNALRIFTDGIQLFGWDANMADHSFVKQQCNDLFNNTLVGFLLEKGLLVHSIQKNEEIALKFVEKWYPECKNLKYTKDGLVLA